MIAVEDVTYTYPGAGSPALLGISAVIEPGSWTALVGANGSGKSTLARLLNGLLISSEGRVVVDGMDTTDEDRAWDVRSRVGLVLQNPDNQIVGTVVEEDVAFGPENLGVPRDELRRRVDEAIAAVRLTGLERREPHLLSEGQKQRLAIAGALAMRPAYLVLDEPTAMLDADGRSDVLDVLRELQAAGTAIIHITHDLAEALLAQRVIALQRGTIAYDGSATALLADDALMNALGLEAPPIARLASALRGAGLDVGAARTAEDVVEALWPS
ncbi:MAG: energy-coupling factor transporter ATPase [Actinobacteria bacterium HGW-Actinobacteria-1]|jgi:energy-coupling factor transport system ATP-binding protein|nr:MAG: energy-coupling factor transporter ATPase [Actinobacteria bacterium HGW-Actinobacteria-1]